MSVSELNRRTRQLLETQFPMVWVEGEISNFVRPSSGHWYFSLKDGSAQVRCAMFRGHNQRLRFMPANGNHVIARARVSLYEGRGDYQLIVEHIEEQGDGALQRAFELLKRKLQQEGLFDPDRKRPLPTLPRHIGVITSPTGAAIRDIVTVLRRRFPAIQLSVFPVPVQGQDAVAAICSAIERANRHASKLQPPLEVLIVGRGGGSLEDLQAFNDEQLARSIAASRLPVVSAVGHEVDFAISDFVADARAATPSAAAEMLSPDQQEWQQYFDGFEMLLRRAIQRRLQHYQRDITSLRKRLRHPGSRVKEQRQRLRALRRRLLQQQRYQLQQRKLQMSNLRRRVLQQHPQRGITLQARRLLEARRRLQLQIQRQQRQHAQQLEQTVLRLERVSPLATLRRGYAIVATTDGAIIRSAATVDPGDQLIAYLQQDALRCTVNERVSDLALPGWDAPRPTGHNND